MPLPVAKKELTFELARSGGPGGQHVNKTSTQVTLCFDVHSSHSLSAGQKQALLKRLAGRINKSGVLRVTSRKHRSQAANRRATVQRFHELLQDALRPRKRRVPTRMPAAARTKRLEQKKKRARLKALRHRPPRADD